MKTLQFKTRCLILIIPFLSHDSPGDSMICRLLVAALMLVPCCRGLAADGEDAAARFTKLATKLAASYTIQAGETSLTLRQEPVLTWTDPENGEIYGGVYLWSDRGRPGAIASIYKWYRPYTHSTHEFQSLSIDPIVGTRAGQNDWRCSKPGVQWKPVPKAPSGGRTTTQRLTQMRLIAKKFTLELIDKDGSVDQLRLLSQPLYHFDQPVGNAVQGTLFAFARGTDPEAFLLLEFRDEDGISKLHYSFARSNFLPTIARYDSAEVWRVERLDRATMKSGSEPYTKYVFQDGEQ